MGEERVRRGEERRGEERRGEERRGEERVNRLTLLRIFPHARKGAHLGGCVDVAEGLSAVSSKPNSFSSEADHSPPPRPDTPI